MNVGQKLTTLRVIAERTRKYATDREASSGSLEDGGRLATQMRQEAQAIDWAIQELSSGPE
jgi:hypothetical protein